MKYDAIVVAGGKGNRADLGFNKVLFKMHNNKTVIENSIELFLNDDDCEKVILVINEAIKINNKKVVYINGGNQRSDSVRNGLELVDSEYVLIHDGARPFLNKDTLEELKKKVEEKDAAILASKAIDTIKKIDGDKIIKTIDRKCIGLAQTPQGFKTSLIKECYAKMNNNYFYDDASVVEACNKDVYVVFNEYDNHKLTSKKDFENI